MFHDDDVNVCDAENSLFDVLLDLSSFVTDIILGLKKGPLSLP